MLDAKKKILVVTTLFPSEKRPYYCIYLLQLFEAMKQHGYVVDIFMPDKSLLDGQVAKTQYHCFDLIHVGYRNQLPHEIAGIISQGFAGSFKKIIEDTHPDIIDINFASLATSRFIISAAQKSGIPTVMHYHGLNVYSDYYVAHPILEKVLEHNKVWIANHADGIVGVSDKVGEIVRRKSNNAAVYTVYNGVDTGLFYPLPEKQNKDFTIICVANLIPIKGQEFLIRAVYNVITKHGHAIKLQLVGAGPEKDKLKALTSELKIADAVEFLGELNYDVVAQKVRQADFFIMPSYFEALGCVYLEAMASGVAVMGVKGCGIDEIIQDRVNGYLVPPCSEKEIEDGIIFALNNPEKHAQIAQRGYETVINGYLWKHAAAQLDRVYCELLNRRMEHA